MAPAFETVVNRGFQRKGLRLEFPPQARVQDEKNDYEYGCRIRS